MYSPIAQKTTASIMYRKQLVARARSIPLGDLEKEVKDYEHQLETLDERGFVRRFFGDFLGVDAEKWNQYQADKLVLRERTNSE